MAQVVLLSPEFQEPYDSSIMDELLEAHWCLQQSIAAAVEHLVQPVTLAS